MSSKMNTETLVRSFLTRLPNYGGWITGKQTQYLLSLGRQEGLHLSSDYTMASTYTEPDGTIVSWSIWRSPNQSGNLKVTYYTNAMYQEDLAKQKQQLAMQLRISKANELGVPFLPTLEQAPYIQIIVEQHKAAGNDKLAAIMQIAYDNAYDD